MTFYSYNYAIGIERLDSVPELLLRLAVLGRVNERELSDASSVRRVLHPRHTDSCVHVDHREIVINIMTSPHISKVQYAVPLL